MPPSERIRRQCRRAAHFVDRVFFNGHPEAWHYFRELLPREFRRRPLKRHLTYNVIAIRVGTGIFTTPVVLRRDHLEIDRAAALQATLDELEKNGVAHGHNAPPQFAQPNNPATGDVEHDMQPERKSHVETHFTSRRRA